MSMSWIIKIMFADEFRCTWSERKLKILF